MEIQKRALTEEERMKEAQKILAKALVKKFVIGVGVTLAVHFASDAIIKVIEQKKTKKDSTEE